tara:strand:+ start:771 stop:1346 length:576 start_codon:yes stop_codon:yes gene_type:complete
VTTTPQQQLRIRYRKIRAELTRIKRDQATRTISQTVINSSWFQRSQNIACYLSTPDEVGTWQIIERALQMKKRIFAPIVKKRNVMLFQELKAKSVLRKNDYGLFEPRDGQLINANNLDVVITPLVAFDHLNNRIGMGGGYFDRTFAFLKDRHSYFHPKLIGVAFACQKTTIISPNPWDVRLYSVISEDSQG